MSRRLIAFVAATVLTALVLLVLNAPAAFATQWGHLVAWIVICLVSETMWSTTLSGSATWSLSACAGLSAVVLFGTGSGLWVSMLSTLIADLFVLRKPAIRAVFNASQITFSAWIAGVTFALLGGRAALLAGPSGAVLDRSVASHLVVPFIALISGYYVSNRAMVSCAVSWSSEERSWWRVLREDWLYLARLQVDAASFLLVPLMVISYMAVGYPGVLLFYAPLFMIFQSDLRYHELKKAEEQNLRNAVFAAKGELAAGIGHELNNILVAISARSQMLLKDAEKQKYDNTSRNAQIILEQSKRMGVLAKGLMDYTRNQVNAEPMDLNGLLMSTIEFVKGEPRFRNVEWEVDLDPSLPELRADVGQIQGVFINLFVNAADAMAAQETRKAIHVTSRLEGRDKLAFVTVRDTGAGIKPEHLPRMFEFMFTTKGDKGHGFGLSTSYRTVLNHGGRFTVDSPPGSGAIFTVALPLGGAPGASN